MSSTRRKFLVNCSTAVAAVVIAPVGAMGMSVISGQGGNSTDGLSHAAFAGQINTHFSVRVAPLRGATLKLVRAPLAPEYRQRPGRRPLADASNERFSLIFAGPRSEPLDEGIHLFEHSRLGRFEMFISRIGPGDATRVRYEAVFNRPMRGAWPHG